MRSTNYSVIWHIHDLSIAESYETNHFHFNWCGWTDGCLFWVKEPRIIKARGNYVVLWSLHRERMVHKRNQPSHLYVFTCANKIPRHSTSVHRIVIFVLWKVPINVRKSRSIIYCKSSYVFRFFPRGKMGRVFLQLSQRKEFCVFHTRATDSCLEPFESFYWLEAFYRSEGLIPVQWSLWLPE